MKATDLENLRMTIRLPLRYWRLVMRQLRGRSGEVAEAVRSLSAQVEHQIHAALAANDTPQPCEARLELVSKAVRLIQTGGVPGLIHAWLQAFKYLVRAKLPTGAVAAYDFIASHRITREAENIQALDLSDWLTCALQTNMFDSLASGITDDEASRLYAAYTRVCAEVVVASYPDEAFAEVRTSPEHISPPTEPERARLH